MIAGMGNALIDVFVEADDAKLKEFGLTKGVMHLVDLRKWDELAQAMPMVFTSSGGSLTNSLLTLAQLGIPCKLFCGLGQDSFAETFKKQLEDSRISVENATIFPDIETGRSLVIVTPDGERTMATYLGASAHFASHHVSMNIVMECSLLCLEGYLISSSGGRDLLRRGLEIARVRDIDSVLTLSGSDLVKTHRADFLDFIDSGLGTVFGNIGEFCALWDTTDVDRILRNLKDRQQTAAITNGAQGSWICGHGELIEIPVVPAKKVIDATGAGDQYLAGFIAGQMRGASKQAAGNFAAVLGSAIVEQISAVFHRDINDLVGCFPQR